LTVSAVFEKLRTALDNAQIPYFVTGSFASSAHGVPRSTNDIDIVIAPTHDQLEQLLATLRNAGFETELEDPFDAMHRSSLFNIVDNATLWKVDLIFKQSTPFDAARFSRRAIVEIAGVHLYAASPEDILITKLTWAKLAGSENDAAGILQVQGDRLDLAYVRGWIDTLRLEKEWTAAQDRVTT
jgi:hypothetical protein